MFRNYKYRIYPTGSQIRIIESHFELCRWLYNTALEHRITAYKKLGKSVTWLEQDKQIPEIRKAFPEFKMVYAQVLQNVIKRVDKGFKFFFKGVKQKRKVGFPRFKGKNGVESITYPGAGFNIHGNRIILSKIGNVKIKLHRDIDPDGKIKTCTISKSGNQWYCLFAVEIDRIVQKKIVNNSVGIDLGLNTFAVMSDGNTIENPRFHGKSQEKLKKIQSKSDSYKWNKTKKVLGRLHRKISNQRVDFLHKQSKKLIDSYDLIVHEDLQIQKMMHWNASKSIQDAGWGIFINMLTYKAENAGTHVIAVNPYRTSQICSGCGNLVKKKLSERHHNCPTCGLSMGRDLNAAHNILKLGTDLGGSAAPETKGF